MHDATMPHGRPRRVARESHDDVDGWGGDAPHCFFADTLGIVRAGLKLNGFQDTLRRLVALYPDRGKLCTYLAGSIPRRATSRMASMPLPAH